MGKSVYLERYSYGPQVINVPPHPELNLVVVIPCYDEPDLKSTLESLNNCLPINGKAEVIVVVNQSTDDPPDVLARNEQTIGKCMEWVESESPGLTFHMTNHTVPGKWAGVGLARKIGMDEATRRFSQLGKDGIIACLDADCTCAPNYLRAVEAHFNKYKSSPGCSIYYEHAVDRKSRSVEPACPAGRHTVEEAITGYELHLRYYTHGLKYSGLPCAFQTVGSAMAVRCSAYQKQGGMNKRKAGEDFYFLQKIIKLGGFTNLNTTTVYPSSRMSHRVPFGTGRAITEFLHQPGSRYLTYHPDTFEDLRYFRDLLPKLFRASTSGTDKIWESLSAVFQGYIPRKKFAETMQELNGKTGNRSSFEKRFFHWVDGFFAFKLANYAREYHYPAVPVDEAASWLLKAAYDLQPASMDVLDILMQYRTLDRTNPKHQITNPK